MEKTKKSNDTKSSWNHYLDCVDYLVSKKTFAIYRDTQTELMITKPKPSDEELFYYYESDDYISHSDSKKGITNLLYQCVKKYTISRKINLINKLQPKGNLLDIGAGTGDLLAACKQNGWSVTGIEPSETARKTANKKLKGCQTEKPVLSAEEITALPDHSFDVITLWHALEHVSDLDESLRQINRLLCPDGTLIIAVPNYKSYDASYYKKYWAAYDVPRHLFHFSQKAVHMLFSKQNFRVTKILPMYFDAFYVSLLSERYKTGKNHFLKAMWVGMRSNLKAVKTKEYSSLIYVLKKQ